MNILRSFPSPGLERNLYDCRAQKFPCVKDWENRCGRQITDGERGRRLRGKKPLLYALLVVVEFGLDGFEHRGAARRGRGDN